MLIGRLIGGLIGGISVVDICVAASWAMPDTFTRFYRMDATVSTPSHTVLSAGSMSVCFLINGDVGQSLR